MRRGSLFFVIALAAVSPACGSSSPASDHTPVDGGPGVVTPTCSVTAPTACPTPAPGYADIQPIIQNNCATPCHGGIPGGPWPLTAYDDVNDWADVIRSDLLDCTMPPADGGVTLSDQDRAAVLGWIRCGSPP